MNKNNDKNITDLFTTSALSRVDSSYENARIAWENAQKNYLLWKNFLQERLDHFREHEQEVIDLLKSFKLEFSTEVNSKTGKRLFASPTENPEYMVNVPKESMQLHMSGYLNMKGRGPLKSERAQQRLTDDIREAFTKKFPRIYLQINSYSLDRRENILFDMWVE